MNVNNFTIKGQEIIQEAIDLVESKNQQAIEAAHLLKGVLKVGENVANFILGKMSVNVVRLNGDIDKMIDSFPKVSGGESYLSR